MRKFKRLAVVNLSFQTKNDQRQTSCKQTWSIYDRYVDICMITKALSLIATMSHSTSSRKGKKQQDEEPSTEKLDELTIEETGAQEKKREKKLVKKQRQRERQQERQREQQRRERYEQTCTGIDWNSPKTEVLTFDGDFSSGIAFGFIRKEIAELDDTTKATMFQCVSKFDICTLALLSGRLVNFEEVLRQSTSPGRPPGHLATSCETSGPST
jgi:hypothetical protein